uniref:Uncharacterized protein n=1 Tax=Arundo donax TaxID=35708 RepID=A0A0A9B2V7_ARUDO
MNCQLKSWHVYYIAS